MKHFLSRPLSLRPALWLAALLCAAVAHATTVTYTTTGTSNWTVPSGVTSVSVLVVGGGGGGGAHIGGGGGGGGVVYNGSYAVTPGSNISVTVGAGGTRGYGGAGAGQSNPGTAGGNSVFGSITSYGGGGGGGAYSNGTSGGSGGGGGGVSMSGASGVSGQGNSGGSYGSGPWRGGGGGGASASGNGGASGSKGGNGVTYLGYTVGGGGGGGSDTSGGNPYSQGGSGGGGYGTWNGGNSTDNPGGNGTTNTGGGGGGGGGGWCSGGYGGSGIVVISYTPAVTNGISWVGTWMGTPLGISLPATGTPGQTISFPATVANSGTSYWDNNYFLELADQYGNHLNYPSISGTASNGTKQVYFSLTLPTTPGSYNYVFTALQNGVTYFGGAQTRTIVVNRPPTTSLSVSTTSTAPGPVTITSTTSDPDNNLINQAIDYLSPGAGSWVSGTGTFRWDGSQTNTNTISPTMTLTPGVWQFRARGSDIYGAASPFQTVTVTVSNGSPPVVTSGSKSGTAGTALTSYQIVASNFPTSYSASGLPSGLSVNTTTGVISGTPTSAGVTTATIMAYNAAGSGSGTLQFTIGSGVNPPVVGGSTTASATVGTAFSYAISASNSPTSYSVVGLPSWLSVNPTTGVITGTPSATGTVNLTLQATNAGGTGTGSLQITISAPSVQTVTFTANNTFTVPSGVTSVQVLVVGGGGGGGWHDGDGGGGGGGGGGD
jgi:hypothetical protein